MKGQVKNTLRSGAVQKAASNSKGAGTPGGTYHENSRTLQLRPELQRATFKSQGKKEAKG